MDDEKKYLSEYNIKNESLISTGNISHFYLHKLELKFRNQAHLLVLDLPSYHLGLRSQPCGWQKTP